MTTNLETEIAIVGAGGCGLVAALAAAEQGARVLLLEKGTAAGGTTSLSAGLIIAAGSHFQQSNGELGTPEELAADIFNKNGHSSDEAVTQALCRVSGPLLDWLAGHGLGLEHLAGYRYPGMSRFWLHAPPERHGIVMVEALLAAVEKEEKIELRLNTPVIGLEVVTGRVAGVRATAPTGEVLHIAAHKVILAADGFGANREMVSQYIPAVGEALYYGAPGAMGEAIRWGLELGAATDHMAGFQPHSSIAYPEELLVTAYLLNSGAIQVNQQGRRFSDETKAYAGHALAIQQQPGRVVYEIFDERIYRLAEANYQRFNESVEAGIIFSANTLAELADYFDLDINTLNETVAAYNAAIARGQDEFGRREFGAALQPPYFGIRVTSALVQTQGGLRLDSQARVLRPDGTPVPNLYAGGGTAAGFAGDDPEGYLAGVGLLAALGLGQIAGREAVIAMRQATLN
jgi:fumarate reductase flavoprotein subunit